MAKKPDFLDTFVAEACSTRREGEIKVQLLLLLVSNFHSGIEGCVTNDPFFV